VSDARHDRAFALQDAQGRLRGSIVSILKKNRG
jgi:hypothetical protein